MEKIKRELKLVCEQEERDSIAAAQLNDQCMKLQHQKKQLSETLGPLQLEHDKIKFIIEATAPHLLR